MKVNEGSWRLIHLKLDKVRRGEIKVDGDKWWQKKENENEDKWRYKMVDKTFEGSWRKMKLSEGEWWQMKMDVGRWR